MALVRLKPRGDPAHKVIGRDPEPTAKHFDLLDGSDAHRFDAVDDHADLFRVHTGVRQVFLRRLSDRHNIRRELVVDPAVDLSAGERCQPAWRIEGTVTRVEPFFDMALVRRQPAGEGRMRMDDVRLKFADHRAELCHSLAVKAAVAAVFHFPDRVSLRLDERLQRGILRQHDHDIEFRAVEVVEIVDE